MVRAALAAAFSNYTQSFNDVSRSRQRVAYQRQNLSWLLLNGMRQLVIEQANMSKVYFNLVLLEKQIRAQLISEATVGIFQREDALTDEPVDEISANPVLQEELEKELLCLRGELERRSRGFLVVLGPDGVGAISVEARHDDGLEKRDASSGRGRTRREPQMSLRAGSFASRHTPAARVVIYHPCTRAPVSVCSLLARSASVCGCSWCTLTSPSAMSQMETDDLPVVLPSSTTSGLSLALSVSPLQGMSRARLSATDAHSPAIPYPSSISLSISRE